MARHRRQHRHWYERLGLPADPFAGPAPVPYWDGERARLLGEILLATASAPAVLAIIGPAGIGKSVLRASAAEHFEGDALCLEVRAHVFLEPETLTRQLWEAWAAATEGTVRETGALRELGQAMAAWLKQGTSITILVDDADELPDACLELLVGLGASFAKRPLRVVLFGREGLAARLARHPKIAHVQMETVAPLADAEVAAYLSERLQLAVPEGAEPLAFTEREQARIVRHSRGVPGQIDTEAVQVLRGRLQLLPRRRRRRRTPATPLWRRAVRWMRTHLAISGGAGIVLILIVGALVGGSPMPSPTASPPAVTPQSDAANVSDRPARSRAAEPAPAPPEPAPASVATAPSASRVADADDAAGRNPPARPTRLPRAPGGAAEPEASEQTEAPDAQTPAPEPAPRSIAASPPAPNPSPAVSAPAPAPTPTPTPTPTPIERIVEAGDPPVAAVRSAVVEAQSPAPAPVPATRAATARTRSAAPSPAPDEAVRDAAPPDRAEEAIAGEASAAPAEARDPAAEAPALRPTLAERPSVVEPARVTGIAAAPEAPSPTATDVAREDATVVAASAQSAEPPAEERAPEEEEAPADANLFARFGALFGGGGRSEEAPSEPAEADATVEDSGEDGTDERDANVADAPSAPVAAAAPEEAPAEPVAELIALPASPRPAARSSRGVAGEREILAMPRDALVLQVMVLSSATRAAVWLAQQQGTGQYATYEREGAWIILRGPFDDRSDAERIARELEQQAGVTRPFVRLVAEVQAEIEPR